MLSDLNKIFKKFIRKKDDAPSTNESPPPSSPVKESKRPVTPKTVQPGTFPSFEEKSNIGKEKFHQKKDTKKGIRKKRAFNKHGIKKISKTEDLERLFEDNTDSEDDSFHAHSKVYRKPGDRPPRLKPESHKPRKISPKVSKKKILDKNGLPIIGNDQDFFNMFLEEENTQELPGKNIPSDDPIEPEEDFGKLLDESLFGKNKKLLLKEKDSAYQYKKEIPVAQKIKRYPAPQNELDLHGFTRNEAREKTLQFIRAEKTNGIYTIRIIVGKGLHSEGGAVLPDVVEDTVQDLQSQKIVLAYKWEKNQKSKSGSIIVYLT